MFLIIGESCNQATRFAGYNNLDTDEWQYATGVRDLHSSDSDTTLIVLNGWGRKRCILQQATVKTAIMMFNRKEGNTTRYMVENEQLWLD